MRLRFGDGDKQYWQRRAYAVERRMGQLEQEIFKLRGRKPLSQESIFATNLRCMWKEPGAFEGYPNEQSS